MARPLIADRGETDAPQPSVPGTRRRLTTSDREAAATPRPAGRVRAHVHTW